MPKREISSDKIFDLLSDILLKVLLPLYLLVMLYGWFFNKTIFWKWFFYGIVFVMAAAVFDIWRRKARFKRVQGFLSDRELLLKLKKMRPTEFEEYIADLFLKLGYKTQTVGGSYDRGIDVIAEKDGIKHYIQCKKFITQKVTVGAMRDFYGAITDHLANGKGYFITTNKFTLEAEKFTEDKPIELIDGQRLIEYIRLAEKETSVLKSSSLGKCPKCGGNLIERKSKFGKFYGCSNYPNCRFTKKV